MRTINCPECKVAFEVNESYLTRKFKFGPFCSTACSNKFYKRSYGSKRIKVNCTECFKEFSVHPSRLKRNVEILCCSKVCMGTIQHKRHLGTKTIRKGGYVFVNIGKKQRKAEHIIIAEKVLGRKLKTGEIVHHINLNKSDNRNSNLLICTQSYHRWLHHQYELAFARKFLRG